MIKIVAERESSRYDGTYPQISEMKIYFLGILVYSIKYE